MAAKLASCLQRFSRLARFALMLLLFTAIFPPQNHARAATLCVSKTNPACYSLIQQAISAAGAGDTIVISAAVYNERLTIGKDLTLRGSTTTQLPAMTTTVNGGNAGSVVIIQNTAHTVILDTLKIINGNGSYGGGIQSHTQHLSLMNVVVMDNFAAYGGGIYSTSGTLELADSFVGGNMAANYGGGIWASGALSLKRTTITTNQTQVVHGGGIYQENGTFEAQDSGISSNTAHNEGGGAYLKGVTATLERATINGNQSATSVGGGIYCEDCTITLTNVTLSGNHVSYAEGGAAIYAIATPGNSVTVSLFSVTIANNSAPAGSGGGLAGYGYNAQSITSFIAAASVFAGNPGGNCHMEANATFTSWDYNVSDDATCALPAHADHASTDPHLQPLAWNAPGYVQTHAILISSPAHRNVEACAETDARGVRRPMLCDSGAYDLSYWLNLPMVVR
jgi:predicted outer membrane repeat protein